VNKKSCDCKMDADIDQIRSTYECNEQMEKKHAETMPNSIVL